MAIIRPATPADAAPLATLKRECFRETFVDGFKMEYPPDDLATFEQASFAVEQVARELADPGRTTWIVERDGRGLGYAQVGPCKLPHPDVIPGAAELYQIYLRGEAQGGGLGGRLLDLALDHLAATRPGPVWLGVWSGNHRAQAVYARRGFAKAGEYLYPVGNSSDHEFIFRRD